MGKMVDVYGIQMTELESMKFSKHIANKGVAMNTVLPAVRTSMAELWLERERGEFPAPDVMIDSGGFESTTARFFFQSEKAKAWAAKGYGDGAHSVEILKSAVGDLIDKLEQEGLRVV